MTTSWLVEDGRGGSWTSHWPRAKYERIGDSVKIEIVYLDDTWLIYSSRYRADAIK